MKRRTLSSSRYFLFLYEEEAIVFEIQSDLRVGAPSLNNVLLPIFGVFFPLMVLICSLFTAEYVCSVAATCFACTTNAGYGRGRYGRRFFSASTTNEWNGYATHATIWNASHGLLLRVEDV